MIPETIKILYAEDDMDLHVITRLALEDCPQFQLQTCINGQEAVDALARFRPDLIILDVMMPKMDGVTAFNVIRSMPEFAQVPIVFLTARIQPAEVETYKQLGAINVIGKPFDPVALPHIIEEIWTKYRRSLKESR
jgi:two-component system, OmpR family, response regulator